MTPAHRLTLLLALAGPALGCGGPAPPAADLGLTCSGDRPVACAGACVNTMSDSRHCGACGTTCKGGEACVAGKCMITCPAGQTVCGNACSNLQIDPMNCGVCGTACKPGEVCSNGACAVNCAMGQTNCSGACANLMTDLMNCGKCAMACKQGEICTMGACTLNCPMGFENCNGQCANPKNDPMNCGKCGTACKQGEVCANGACVSNCAMGQENCNGACANLMTDLMNCGKCGMACPMGQQCAGGVCGCPMGQDYCANACVNLQSDLAHCGACGTACKQGELCLAGKCAVSCQMPLVACNNKCVDTRFDPENCSACGMACPSIMNGQRACAMGKCGLAGCDKGFFDCDGGVQNGCEINSANDVKNCGACGKACGAGAGCCNGACMSLINDPMNCGACGTACGGGEKCCSGKCIPMNQAGACVDCAKPCHGQTLKGDELKGGKLVRLDQNMGGVQTQNLPAATPFVWVVMHDSNQANKLDVKTGDSLGLYPTMGGGPSRNTLALDETLWIAHRCDWEPNNGACSNVVQMNPDGTIACIVTKAADGQPLPFVRALTLDGDGYVWAGTWNDSRAHKIDPLACKTILDVPLPGNPYGMAVDSKGLLWTSTIGSGNWAGLNTRTGKVEHSINHGGRASYGVTIDRNDNVYYAQWSNCGGGIWRVDANTKAITDINPRNPGAACTRGITLDNDGNIWTTYWTGGQPSYASKFSGGSGAFLATFALNSIRASVGISADLNGKIWLTSGNFGGGGHTVGRLSKDGQLELQKPITGANAYNYSDWNGSLLRTVTTKNGQTGTWNGLFDGGTANTTWQGLAWKGNLPPGAQVRARARAATSQQLLAKAAWCAPFNSSPADLKSCSFGPNQWLEVQLWLYTNSGQSPAQVGEVSVTYQN